jgi:hypothetical protein
VLERFDGRRYGRPGIDDDSGDAPIGQLHAAACYQNIERDTIAELGRSLGAVDGFGRIILKIQSLAQRVTHALRLFKN